MTTNSPTEKHQTITDLLAQALHCNPDGTVTVEGKTEIKNSHPQEYKPYKITLPSDELKDVKKVINTWLNDSVEVTNFDSMEEAVYVTAFIGKLQKEL